MIKELKYLFFILIISLFIFLTLKYYFSDNNKKNSYRSLKYMDIKIIKFSQDLILLDNDTDNTVEYVEKIIDKNKKNYNFWKLINTNE
jgi:predicted negative regulator of RcsB-dependent stress response|tara:strand:- start:703 stop:966 length:264 start_codon:yes stop_codon:yes gene_type:complete